MNGAKRKFVEEEDDEKIVRRYVGNGAIWDENVVMKTFNAGLSVINPNNGTMNHMKIVDVMPMDDTQIETKTETEQDETSADKQHINFEMLNSSELKVDPDLKELLDAYFRAGYLTAKYEIKHATRKRTLSGNLQAET